MMRLWLQVRRLFGQRRFGCHVPRGTCADISLLPEDRFPVVCTHCGYLLRGLTGSACPECGEDFDRAELLVSQYVMERGWRFQAALSKTMRVSFAITFLFLAGTMTFFILVGILARLGEDYFPQLVTLLRFSRLMLWISPGAVVFWVIAIACAMTISARGSAKARQVFDAIEWDSK